jgi:cyclomaltodextrinase
MKNNFQRNCIPLLLSIFLVACGTTQKQKVPQKKYVVTTKVEHADWTENAVIYEVNIRQYTPEGTIKAFMEYLPQLEDLGVDILWIMPVQPIGKVKRKGTLGSYYSIRDYMSVNTEYGTMKNFKDLVEEAHTLGMYVILDWVANHTAWDNPLIGEHPDWYKKDSLGNIVSPYDWTDVAQLDYNNPALQEYMTNAMTYWVKTTGIDGFRCDVAGLVPCEFWDKTREAFDKIKPVFMLAEDEKELCLMKTAFDMNYSWELYHLMNDIAKGTKTVSDLKKYYHEQDSIYDPAIYRMNFITNHDENSWNGTVFERLDGAVELFAMLTFTLPGVPLIYSGQEIGMKKSLRFFDKDTIQWIENKWEGIYKNFIELKTDNSVFWNGTYGGSFEIINLKDIPQVFAFERTNENESALVFANLGDMKTEFKLPKKYTGRDYTDAFTQDEVKSGKSIKLKGYKYMVLLEEY